MEVKHAFNLLCSALLDEYILCENCPSYRGEYCEILEIINHDNV